MERENKNSSSKSSVLGTGIICSFIGAAIGAIGYHLMTREEPQKHEHSEKVFNNGGSCPICLGDTEELTVLPCGHQYHKCCIQKLKASEHTPKCPVCRKPI